MLEAALGIAAALGKFYALLFGLVAAILLTLVIAGRLSPRVRRAVWVVFAGAVLVLGIAGTFIPDGDGVNHPACRYPPPAC